MPKPRRLTSSPLLSPSTAQEVARLIKEHSAGATLVPLKLTKTNEGRLLAHVLRVRPNHRSLFEEAASALLDDNPVRRTFCPDPHIEDAPPAFPRRTMRVKQQPSSSDRLRELIPTKLRERNLSLRDFGTPRMPWV